MEKRTGKIIHYFFLGSILAKAIDGLIEVASGLVLVLVSKGKLIDLVYKLTSTELSEDKNDLIANWIINNIPHVSVAAQHFAAYYLLSHGIVKVILVLALFKRKLWAYPVAMFAFSVFVVYQSITYFQNHSFLLLVLTVLDIAVVLLTYWEFKRLKGETAKTDENKDLSKK